MDKVAEDMDVLNYKLWSMLEPYTRNQDDVMMASAVMLKICIQLYTIVMEDEEIAAFLSHEAIESIPNLRMQLQQSLKMSIH